MYVSSRYNALVCVGWHLVGFDLTRKIEVVMKSIPSIIAILEALTFVDIHSLINGWLEGVLLIPISSYIYDMSVRCAVI